METKANYVAAGAFVLACVIGIAGRFYGAGGSQYSQEYAYYQAYFTGAVTGLGKGTVTRYNGIDVGRVEDLQFDPNNPQRVIVTLQLQPGLSIREDSTASIDSQGFTGAAFVEISGGTPTALLLVAKNGQKYPVIATKQSTLEQLEQSAPELVAKLNNATSSINDLLNDDNRHAIAQILNNLDVTTAAFARRSEDFDATIKNANAATANLRDASAELKPTLQDVDLAVGKFGKVADDADVVINGDSVGQIQDLVGEMRRLVSTLNKFSEQLNRAPTTLLFGDRRKGYEPK